MKRGFEDEEENDDMDEDQEDEEDEDFFFKTDEVEQNNSPDPLFVQYEEGR